MIEVTKQTCQASYDWQFVHSLKVQESTPSLVRSVSELAIGMDPFIERKLGHYSSGLLLEAAKQISKATFVLTCKGHEHDRFVVERIEMDFENYVILDDAHPVTLGCAISDMAYRDGIVQAGHVTVTFTQGGQTAATVRFICTLMPAAIEERIEKRLRTRLAATQSQA